MIRYVCGNCGYVLYEYRTNTRCYAGLPSPRYVYSKHNGVCPRCGKRLEPPTPENWRERIVVELKLRKLVKQL